MPLTPLILLFALLATPPVPAGDASDPVRAEADRLWTEAQRRHGEPGGAVDLWRLDRLGGWLPRALVEDRLRQAGRDRKATPLYRAMAWWLLRERLERRLDDPSEAVAALGLLDGFAMRPGPAPTQSAAPLAPDGFRPYPRGAGHGELWLEAFLRPAQETSATLATRLVAPGGPAVLRLGYDDAITVWLNGDELHKSDKEHPAWLDQVAIPVNLRKGDNILVIELRQHSGAWRLLARVTDAEGEPLAGISAHPDPFGPIPEPAEGPKVHSDEIAHLYAALSRAESKEPPDAVGLRDLADYAQAAALPDADRLLPRVAVESAWEADPSPRTLRAWLELLPEAEQGPVRTSHVPARPLRSEDVHADLALRLDEAWAHFHGRRFLACREVLEALERDAPGFLPSLKLRATLLEELGLPNQAVALLEARGAPTGPANLRAAWRDALRAAGRSEALHAALQHEVALGEATADVFYQLATARRARADENAALSLLDRIQERRPELWGYTIEAIEIEQYAGHRDAARARLERVLAAIPDEPSLLLRRARMQVAAGESEEALATLDRALTIDPSDQELRRYRAALDEPRTPQIAGPPLETLLKTADPAGAPAHVLYHEARARVAPTGLAVREVRRVVRVLTAEGARMFNTWELVYSPGVQRLDVRVARLIRPGDPPQSPRRSDRDLSEPAWRLYYDLRAEVLSFPRVAPGDVIEVDWQITDLDPDPSFPGYFGELAYLQEAVPRARSVVAFETSLPLKIHVEARGLPVSSQNNRFELRDAPAVLPEPYDPGPSSARAYVHVSTLDGWSDADRRYRQLLGGRDVPDAKLAALAKTWAGDAKTPEEKIRRLHHRVASGLRYVGLELGTHSYRPESPHVTLARGFGDCKDKATLVIALLRAVDVAAQLALVRTTSQGNVAPLPASFALFDHAMVYLPDLDRFVDPTQDRNEPFALPPPDQGASVFVVGQAPELRRTPFQRTENAGESWKLDLTLAPDGRLAGAAVWTLRGAPATNARQSMEAEANRRQHFEAALAARFPGAHAADVTLTGLAPADDPVTATATVKLPPLARDGTPFRLPRAGRPWMLVDALAHATIRRQPLLPGPPRHAAFEMTVKLPPGSRTELFPPLQIPSEFGTFEATARQEGDVLHLAARWTLRSPEIPPERYAAFRAWLGEVDRALEAAVRIHAGGRR